MNQVICDNRVSEMKALESLSVDEYYQTISTWMKIMDERAKAMEGGSKSKGNEADGQQRRRLKSS